MAVGQGKREDKQPDLASLEGAFIWARVFDDPHYKDDLYKGIIMEEKSTKRGLYVLFKTDDLVGQKWIPLNWIKGRAQYVPATQKTAS